MTDKKSGMDAGPAAGEWLFRQEGLVLGPIPASRLVEMLNSGEADGRTEIARMGSSTFQHLAQVDVFKVHLAKAEAKKRVDHSAAQDKAKQTRRRTVKVAIIGGVALGLAVASAAGAQYLAIHNPFSSAEEDLLASITVEPPTITVARAHQEDEELVDYPGAAKPRPVAVKTPATQNSEKPATTATTAMAANTAKPQPGKPVKKPIGSTTTRPPKMSDPGEDPDGMQMAQFDQAAINSVVASHQKKLYACFVEEAKRAPGFAAKIPIEFVIGNDGRVAKLWVDHPQYKTGPLYDCLFANLQKWPFKPYEGERATVGLSFNIGKSR